MNGRRLTFYYDFASTYSYLSAMRIEELAARIPVDVAWKPFLLGPIFKAQGWDTSPFNLYPQKGAYMWRDMQRLADAYDLPFMHPEPFPQNGLLAARLALVGSDAGWTAQFTRAVYFAEFGAAKNIADPEVLKAVLETIGVDAEAAMWETRNEALKQRLKDNGADAERQGVFGAPSFVTPDGELFWGNDRLEAALDWAASSI